MTKKERMTALRKIIAICIIKTAPQRVYTTSRESWYKQRRELRMLGKRSPTHYDFLLLQEAYCLKTEESYVSRRYLRPSGRVDAIFIPAPVHAIP